MTQPWVYSKDRKSLNATFRVKDFRVAVRLIEKAAKAAEKMDHHPDIHLTRYRRLRFVLTTHSRGRVTAKDHKLAKVISRLAGWPLAIFMLFVGVGPAMAGGLDGKVFDATIGEDRTKIEFKDGRIYSPIHQKIADSELGAPIPDGPVYSETADGAAVAFSARVEAMPVVYWSGKVSGAQLEGSITIDGSIIGPDSSYILPFKGEQI